MVNSEDLLEIVQKDLAQNEKPISRDADVVASMVLVMAKALVEIRDELRRLNVECAEL